MTSLARAYRAAFGGPDGQAVRRDLLFAAVELTDGQLRPGALWLCARIERLLLIQGGDETEAGVLTDDSEDTHA